MPFHPLQGGLEARLEISPNVKDHEIGFVIEFALLGGLKKLIRISHPSNLNPLPLEIIDPKNNAGSVGPFGFPDCDVIETWRTLAVGRVAALRKWLLVLNFPRNVERQILQQ